MKTIVKGMFLVVVGSLGAVAGIAVDRLGSQAKPGPIVSGDVPPVHALGSIQPLGGVVEVAVPAGLRPLRFDRGIDLNRWVQEGQVLAYLDGYEERQREVDVINAEIKAAGQALNVENENERASLEEIDQERAKTIRLGEMQVESLKLKTLCLEEKSRLARKQLEDVEGLQHNNTVSLQQYEQLRSQADISLDEWKYARAERDRARKELDLTTNPETIARQKNKVRIAAARARGQFPLETLRRKKELAQAAMLRCAVVAPVAGRVLEITTHAGESAAGKPLLKLGNTDQIYVLAEVYEDDRKRVRVEQKAEIQGRGLPFDDPRAALHGTVQRISPIVGGHKQAPLDPTYRENARVYEAWIKVELDENQKNDQGALEKLRQYILQPVDVMFQVDGDPAAGRAAEEKNHPDHRPAS